VSVAGFQKGLRWLEWLWEWLREVQQGRKSQINNEQRLQLGA
jgi:hypothetical protein